MLVKYDVKNACTFDQNERSNKTEKRTKCALQRRTLFKRQQQLQQGG